MNLIQEIIHIARKLNRSDRERLLNFAQRLFELSDQPKLTMRSHRLKRQVERLEDDLE